MAEKHGSYKMLYRIARIHEFIKSGSYPNCKDLADELENDSATIHRDIEILRNDFNAPVEFDQAENGYYYTDPDFHPIFPTITDEAKKKYDFDKSGLADYLKVPEKYIDILDEVSDLNFHAKSKLTANLEKKYCGRSFFDGSYWVGLKTFDFSNDCKFCISIFEDYNSSKISAMLKRKKKNFIAEDSPIDEGYWLYVLMDISLIEINTELAKSHIKDFINFLRN